MKKSIWAISLICLLGCANEELGCTKRQPQFCTVYMFVDVTDAEFRSTQRYISDVPLILRKMNIDTLRGGDDGGELRLFLINNLSESKSKFQRLEKGVTGLLGQNRLDRIDEIKRFSRAAWHDIVSLLEGTTWQTEQSKIYQNLCRELNNLVKTNSDRKIVIIYSDMLENSEIFSFYGADLQKVHRYLKDTALANAELKIDCQMPDLSGVEMNIVTYRNVTNDEVVNLASQFWTELFQRQHATVRFGAELRGE